MLRLNILADVPRIEGTIPVDLPIENDSRFLFISHAQRSYTHSLHKYPAKFFPELPRWIIERFSDRGDYILDPFMGSGTTNLEALLLERNSMGIDVDPFSRFIAKVKTTPIQQTELCLGYDKIKEYIGKYDEKKVLDGIPEFPYRDNWFKPYILKELAYIKKCINRLDTSQKVKNFFLVNFSSIIRATSEADNNCTRTVIRKKLNKQVLPGAALKMFLKRTENGVRGMLAFAGKQPAAKVDIPDTADARDINICSDNTFDLALTSPPYLNAVDYPRTHQLEIYCLGIESGSLRNLKSNHVGTEVVSSRDYKDLHETGCDSADKVIKQIYQVDPRRAYIATKYIQDMTANLQEVYRVLKPNKNYVVVIGNNMVRGKLFETWKYLKEIALTIGYEVECNFISEIINHYIKIPRRERINDDHVLVLRK